MKGIPEQSCVLYIIYVVIKLRLLFCNHFFKNQMNKIKS